MPSPNERPCLESIIMENVHKIQTLLKDYAATSTSSNARFFKTGKGEYAEHDQFIGVPIPVLRTFAKNFSFISLQDIQLLLESTINEQRLLALFILVAHYQKATIQHKNDIYQFYIKNMRHINNWNLVDASAHLVIGAYLWDKNRDLLIQLAHSNDLWEKRIAIISTLYFIRKSDLEWTFKIATILLNDNHDLIHKATGWMLREAGKQDEQQLKDFLNIHAPHMPRTMLRYAIEKLPEDQRASYLAQKNSRTK
jgi:3-methyladenine DNA glycosylase AlkD